MLFLYNFIKKWSFRTDYLVIWLLAKSVPALALVIIAVFQQVKELSRIRVVASATYRLQLLLHMQLLMLFSCC